VSVGLFLGHGVKSRCGCGHDTSPPTQPQRWQGIGIRASATPDASSCTAISWLAGTDSCQEFGRGLYLHHQVHWPALERKSCSQWDWQALPQSWKTRAHVTSAQAPSLHADHCLNSKTF
jgi:hypothetical protein